MTDVPEIHIARSVDGTNLAYEVSPLQVVDGDHQRPSGRLRLRSLPPWHGAAAGAHRGERPKKITASVTTN